MKVWNWTVARLTFCRFCMEGGDGSNKSPMHSWDLAVKWIKGTTYLLKAQGKITWNQYFRFVHQFAEQREAKSQTHLGTWAMHGPWEHGSYVDLETIIIQVRQGHLSPEQKSTKLPSVISSKDSSIGVFLCGRLNWLEDWLRLRLRKICDLYFQLFCGGARVLVLANFAFFAVFSFASDHPMFGHV